MKIRVLHVINDLSLGGAETLLANWLPILNTNEQFEVHLLVMLKNVGTEANISKLKNGGVTIHSLGLSGLYGLNTLRQFYSFFKSNARFDIVHAHLFPTFYLLGIIKPLLGKKQTSFIFTEHSTKNKRINNNKFYLIEKYIYDRYDYVIAISDAVYQKIANWVISPNKVKLIKNGLTLNRVSLSSELSLIDQHSNKKKILMVARFVSSKDHVGLLKALQVLKAKGTDFQLYLAGDGVEQAKVAKLAETYNLTSEVTFLGYVAEARSLMGEVDLNVLCSDYEGFSGVTIESILSKKPFIGSDVDGIREIVANANSLYRHGDEQELAHKINLMLTDEELAIKSVVENYNFALQFDINNMVEQHTELYKQLVNVSLKNN